MAVATRYPTRPLEGWGKLRELRRKYAKHTGEMCSSMHHQIGQMLLGLTQVDPISGVSRPVDFVFETNFCHSAAKTAQIAGELMGVPYFILDVPHMDGEATVRYVVGRLMDSIGWMEKATGRTFDDGRFVEAMGHW